MSIGPRAILVPRRWSNRRTWLPPEKERHLVRADSTLVADATANPLLHSGRLLERREYSNLRYSSDLQWHPATGGPGTDAAKPERPAAPDRSRSVALDWWHGAARSSLNMELVASWASFHILRTYPKGRRDTRIAAWSIMLAFPFGVVASEIAQTFDASAYGLVFWIIGFPFLIAGMVSREDKRFPK